MTIVNDPAERAVQICSEFLGPTRSEDFFQKVLEDVSDHRMTHPTSNEGQMTTDTLKTLAKERKPGGRRVRCISDSGRK